MKPERNVNEKGREEGKKPGKMLDALKKMGVTPLKATIAAVATTAVLATGCGSTLDVDKRDADEDVESEVPELIARIPRPPVEAEIPLPRDSETDGDVVEDSVEDGVADVPEEVAGICEPTDEASTELIRKGESAVVGNISVEYKGMDVETETTPMFDITCDGVVVRSNISVPVDDEVVVDVPENGFEATIKVNSGNDAMVYVDIDVDAY